MKLDVQGQGGERILDVARQGVWTIFMDVICVSLLFKNMNLKDNQSYQSSYLSIEIFTVIIFPFAKIDICEISPQRVHSEKMINAKTGNSFA